MRGDPAGIFLAPSPVCCGVRQFGSDRGSSGLVTDMSDPARMTQSRRAASRYSITSSTRSRIDGGTARPTALAVLAFKAITNLTGS